MRVAIAGYGSEGESSYRYYTAQGADVTILDESDHPKNSLPTGATSILGQSAFSDLSRYDLVLRTPPLRPERLSTATRVWSATNEFFAQCPAPIIGVTGTKGKGTTSTLIYKILINAGIKAHLVGNIGVPALDELSQIKHEDVIVFELSSFQLWDLQKSPHIAVLLMIARDHMDVHKDMNEYINAKAQIIAHQTQQDVLIHHPSNNIVQSIIEGSRATLIPYMGPKGCHIDNEHFVIDETTICSLADVRLIGQHNQENICAAITAAWQYTQDVEAIRKAVREFTGLEHRLEFVREVAGVKYYNDSQSTIPDATIAAIKSFDVPEIVILGGSDKGADLSLVTKILDSDKHRVILIGENAQALEALLNQRGFSQFTNLGTGTTMTEIVKAAAEQAVPGSVVILSPACASFGMFKNYQDRGTQFKAAVSRL